MEKKKKKQYTKLPCGLRLYLDVETGEFDLVGDIGGADDATAELPNKIHLNIASTSKNLIALSAFFLARAQEAEKD